MSNKSVEVSDEEMKELLIDHKQVRGRYCNAEDFEAGFIKACELRAIKAWPSEAEQEAARWDSIRKVLKHEEDYTNSWDDACAWLKKRLCGE